VGRRSYPRSEIIDGMSFKESNIFHNYADMMQVDAPSLKMQQWMMEFLMDTGI
jgi:hypothetical protein